MDIYKLMGYLPITILMAAIVAGVIYYFKNGRKIQKDNKAILEEDNENNKGTDEQQPGLEHVYSPEGTTAVPQKETEAIHDEDTVPFAEETEEQKDDNTLMILLKELNDYTIKWCDTADSIKKIFQEIIDTHSPCFVEGKAYVSFSKDPISLQTLAVEIEFDKEESAVTIEGITSLYQDIQEKGFVIRRSEIGTGFSEGKKSLILYIN